MKEISLNILDIAENSVKAGATLIEIDLTQTGAVLQIVIKDDGCGMSPENTEEHGTTVTALFHTDHIDFMPLGDMASTVCTLIHGSPDIDFLYQHKTDKGSVKLDTREVRSVLGEDVSLDCFEVMEWIREYLEEQYQALEIQNNK